MKRVVSQRGRAHRILICHYWKCFSGAEFFTLSISRVVLEEMGKDQGGLIQRREMLGFVKWDLEEDMEIVLMRLNPSIPLRNRSSERGF